MGSAAAVFGLAWGAVALGQQNQLQGELDAGATRAGVLQPKSVYEGRASGILVNQLIALSSLVVGAALVLTGALLMPGENAAPASVALVPTFNGGALVGVFP